MKLTNFHTHTVFCDGHHSPQEIAEKAIEKGFDVLGFSEHYPVFFDPAEGMKKEEVPVYIETVNALKQKYSGRIKLYCGTEVDYYTDVPTEKFDYIIGSVHYVKKDGKYAVVDCSPEKFTEGVNTLFGGDVYAFAENYYAAVSDVVNRTDCDIIGHFDLVTKFNEKHSFIDENHPRYRKAAIDALEKLLPTGRLFEINTGAISRGHRTTPYPSEWLLSEIAKGGGRVILSSDSHDKNTIDCAFDGARRLAEHCGFTEIEELPLRLKNQQEIHP